MQKIISILTLIFLTANAWSQQQETSVLFIGNSFTFMNNMPFMFRDIALAEGKKIHVDTVVEGGKDFNFHAHNPETYAAIRSRKWDYIIIQGHSNELAQPESVIDKNSLPYAKQITDSIHASNPCTQVVLYMTWGYKNGNPKWSAIAAYEPMQDRIETQYLRFADLLDARISPVGEVWKNLRASHPALNLYYSDNIHPSYAGSYVSACTFYASIFGESPLKNSSIVSLDADTRQIIEYTVSQVVLNNLNRWRFIQKSDRLISGFDMVMSGRNLQIYDRSENSTWIEWNFGDGHTSTDKNPFHEYSAAGKYQVTQKISMYCKSIELVREIDIK